MRAQLKYFVKDVCFQCYLLGIQLKDEIDDFGTMVVMVLPFVLLLLIPMLAFGLGLAFVEEAWR